MDIFLQALLIFCARICDVSMGTLRTILIVKGFRKIAATIGFFEVMIYIAILGKVVGGINKPILILAYGLGYACGNFVGSKLEEKLSIGKIIAQIIINDEADDVVEKLRASGFGVTIFEGEGRDGKRYMLNIILERKKVKALYDIVGDYHDNAFITTMDIRSSLGGYFQPKKF